VFDNHTHLGFIPAITTSTMNIIAEPIVSPLEGLDKRDWIAGLEKGLSLIQTFDEANSRQTATQAGLRCGLTRTAARRYLLTLLHLGYVATDGKLFWLTPRVMRLGQSYLESARLPRIVQPSLQRVAMGTQEISFVAVLDGDDIVYVARNGQNRSMNTSFALGARVPAHTTASGMLLMALQGADAVDVWLKKGRLRTFTSHTITDPDRLRQQMAHIRAQDWSLSEQQLDLTYRGVAVPLRDHKGNTIAALSVSMPMQFESSQQAIERVLPLLRETAQSLRQLL
jgi:IclR family transcriptional regulator, pca regulon regulatory protein